MEKSVREILYDALRDLTEEQFKDFKWKLRYYHCEERGTIPWGQLEAADRRVAIDLLYGYYGDDDAATSASLEVLERISARTTAENVQSALDLTPTSRVTAEGYKLEYRNYLKEKFQTLKDLNSLPGEFVLLKERYSNLIILDHHRPEKEREHEILTSGWEHDELMEKRKSCSITIQTLFQRDKSGLIPNTVVLQGAAGIGKTMTARKIMLDWASGELHQNLFDYVFYIHCRGMNLGREEKSLADVILTQGVNKGAIKGMLKNPRKMLFVIDGFDELRFSVDQPEDCLCSDPWKKTPMSVLLNSLFRRKLLPESYLIITTRPTALEKLRLLLGRSRYAEILGFSPNDRREYFHRFFQNKEHAEKAFQVVHQNETLFTICFVPIVCWIICTVMKQQLDRGENLLQTSNTITAVYMLYLSSFLKTSQSDGKKLFQTRLRGLCSLAADGIWKQKILFWEEEIQTYGLDQEDSLPLFLNENIFKRDIECICSYSFIHLSFQEFFAALSYLLEEENGSLPPDRDIETLLERYRTSRPDLALTVRFLFGLLNEEQRIRNLKEKFGWKISPRIKKLLLQWMKKAVGTKLNCPSYHEVDVLQLLYETHDEDFLKSSLNHVMEVSLKIIHITDMDALITSFCLKNCHNLKVLSVLSIIAQSFEKLIQHICEAVMYGCKKLEEIRLEEGALTTAGCQHVASILATSRTLKKLNLEGNELGDAGVKVLCEGLKHPDCQLQTLLLGTCGLTAACSVDLAFIFGSNSKLVELNLEYNALEDSGVQLLCVGLKQPYCQLQILGLANCSLTEACCGALASILATSQSLKELDVEGNRLGDGGLKLLCEGLKHPHCRLQKLNLYNCDLSADCCKDLALVLHNGMMSELYLGSNKLGESGMKLLCKGLKYPLCKLQKLCLCGTEITPGACKELSSVLRMSPVLEDIDFWDNPLGDSGIRFLCEGLKDPGCKLQVLSMQKCNFTAASCEDLCSALSTNPNLKKLQLEGNELGDEGVQLLCKGLRHPSCKLRKIGLDTDKLMDETVEELLSLKRIKPDLIIDI